MAGHQEAAPEMKVGSIVKIIEGIHLDKLAKVTNIFPISNPILG